MALASQPREADRHAVCQGPRAVEDDQPEGPAPQQDIGTPRRRRGGGRGAHDPQPFGRGQCRPIGGGQRPRRVDVGNPSFVVERLSHDSPHQRRLPTAARPHDFRQPPIGKPALGERGIERGDPGRDPAPRNGRELRRDDGGELLAECGERHELQTGDGRRETGDTGQGGSNSREPNKYRSSGSCRRHGRMAISWPVRG